jgi:hypothetical protein
MQVQMAPIVMPNGTSHVLRTGSLLLSVFASHLRAVEDVQRSSEEAKSESLRAVELLYSLAS